MCAMRKIISFTIAIFVPVFLGNVCSGSEKNKVCLKDKCLYVELAQTDSEKSRGLMFREHLDSNKGMLFIYNEETDLSFWMKNVLIPLDIVWINSEQEVVLISENVQPCHREPCSIISPDAKVRYVLEMNSFKSREMGLRAGDKLEIHIN